MNTVSIYHLWKPNILQIMVILVHRNVVILDMHNTIISRGVSLGYLECIEIYYVM